MDAWNYVAGGLSRFSAWLKSLWPSVRRGGAILLIIALISIIIFSVWVNSFDPTGFGLIDATDRPFWVKFGPIAALILVFLKGLWEVAKSDGSLRHIVVSRTDQTDVKQMAKYMKDADSVVIYSGDFSYIYNHDPLYEALNDLSMRQNLIFISYKSKETVLQQSESSRGQKNCIINNLISNKNISFDVHGRAKFSLVYRKGEEVLLYRHREEDTDYVTVFKASNAQTKQLVVTVKTLVDTILNDHPTA